MANETQSVARAEGKVFSPFMVTNLVLAGPPELLHPVTAADSKKTLATNKVTRFFIFWPAAVP